MKNQFKTMYKIMTHKVFIVLLLAAGFITACSKDGGKSQVQSLSVTPISNSSNPLARQTYHALLGEMYGFYGEVDESLSHYMEVVKENDSADVARRVTELASRGSKNSSALIAAEKWVKNKQDSVDAHQYLALLNIRMEKPEAAAKELLWLQKYLDKNNKHGFAFVATLVSFETNKETAYEAFKLFAQQSSNPDEAGLALAALAINAGNFDDVLEAVATARKSPKIKVRERANLFYAKAMMSLDRVDEAIAELKTVVAESKSSDLKLEYARLLILAERYDEAHKLFDQLYQENPNDIDILYTLGLLYIDMKRFDDAQPLFEKLAKMHNAERSGEAHYFLGKIYEAQDHYEDAILEYGKAENTNFFQEAEISKTKLIHKKKGLASAREYLHKRIETADDEEETISLLLLDGQLLYQEKQYKDSLSAYQKILKLKPNDFDGLYSRSLVYSQMGDIKNAEQDLKKILLNSPDNVTALNALGYSLAVYTTRYDEAKNYVSKALELQPEDPAIIDSMGWIEYRSGNFEEAEKLLRRAYKKLPDPEVASHLIEVLSKTGQVAEAEKMLSDMLKKHPNDENLAKVQKKLSQVGASN